MADSDFDYDSVVSYGESDPGDDSYGHIESDVEEEYYEGSDSEEEYYNKESVDGDDFCQSSKDTKSYDCGENSKPSYKDLWQSNSQQWTTTKNSIVDKQTGGYYNKTVKESISTGDVFKERSTGRLGYKDEYKTTSTYKAGDKSGYSEYQVEKRYHRVDYGDSSRGKGSNYLK